MYTVGHLLPTDVNQICTEQGVWIRNAINVILQNGIINPCHNLRGWLAKATMNLGYA